VWENFEALVWQFKEEENDPTRDKNGRCMYQGLQRKITSTEFVLDLGFMCSPGIVGIEPGAARPKHKSILGGCEG
jgi:hypothetical protein